MTVYNKTTSPKSYGHKEFKITVQAAASPGQRGPAFVVDSDKANAALAISRVAVAADKASGEIEITLD